jgi:short-subunit dehydrogenase
VAAGRRGAKLILAARNEHLLRELADELQADGAEVEIVLGDVTNGGDRQRMIQAAIDRFGGLDVLINNAGIGATGHFAEASEDRLRKIMEVNFFGMSELTRLAIPVLTEGTTPMLVNISSIAAKRGIPARSEYSASKFALQGLSEALRPELARYGIDLLVVCPGLTATNFSKNMVENKARLPMDHKRSMTPDQVAEATLRAMVRGKREIVLTGAGKLLIFVSRFFPWFVERVMARKVRALYKDEIEERRWRRQENQEKEKRETVGAAP